MTVKQSYIQVEDTCHFEIHVDLFYSHPSLCHLFNYSPKCWSVQCQYLMNSKDGQVPLTCGSQLRLLGRIHGVVLSV